MSHALLAKERRHSYNSCRIEGTEKKSATRLSNNNNTNSYCYECNNRIIASSTYKVTYLSAATDSIVRLMSGYWSNTVLKWSTLSEKRLQYVSALTLATLL